MSELLETFGIILDIYYWNFCSIRVVAGLSHEGKMPLQAIDSTLITLVQNEIDFVLNQWSKGVNQLRAQAWVRICDLHLYCFQTVNLSYAQTMLYCRRFLVKDEAWLKI